MGALLIKKKATRLIKEVNMKVVSLFSGIGGIDIGFSSRFYKTIYMNELDEKARVTLGSNFSKIKIDGRDLKDIKPKEIPNHDVLLAGFPCQAFSIAGYRKGFEDERGDLFFYVLKIAIHHKPKVIFLENVKNLISHDNGNTFETIRTSLIKNGYYVKYKVMNAKDYGNIPQNRERIYIVAFKSKEVYKNFEFPPPIKLITEVSDLLEKKVDSKFYYNNENFKNFDLLSSSVKSMGVIYQWRRHYVRENKSFVCPTLTANMGTGGHNVPIVIDKKGIRKLTPRECYRFQGFDEKYVIPDLANCHLYKQIGNSVVVPVVRRIANNIQKAFLEYEENN